MKNIKKTGDECKARFAMAFHAFQPVFNFESELEKAYEMSYRPFLEVLERFPIIKATFHFSGNMLEWFEKKKRGYLDIMRPMVDRGQIEIMGGGFFEPVMPAIPARDAADQIRMMSAAVERIFGVKPSGVWTTERVWHRNLADLYQREGIAYTILDDNHLFAAFPSEISLHSPCLTYGDSGSVTVFPASTKLRYLMPFRPVERTIDYLKNSSVRKISDRPCFFFADDLEKFGAWPRTNRHVYRKKWLERFFSAITEESEWLETATYSEIEGSSAKQDVGVILASSYQEMDSWSGGDFFNFMKRYPESGRMYERMTELSEKVSENIPGKRGDSVIGMGSEAKKELFKAQTSCPYWHGTFGGIYLPHLRAGVYSHIIRAEKILDETSGGKGNPVFCVERKPEKGKGEFIMGNSHMKIYVNPDRGAVIEEIDMKGREINLINSFSRRREGYHRKLEKGYGSVIRKARRNAINSDGDHVDIHEILGVSGKNLGRILTYDGYRRTGFITRIAEGNVRWDKFRDMRIPESSPFGASYSSVMTVKDDLITQTFSKRGVLNGVKKEGSDIEVVKAITLGKAPAVTVTQSVKNFSVSDTQLTCGLEFNILISDEASMRASRTFVSEVVELEDRYTGLEVKFFMDRPLKVSRYPIYTINETERGLGKTFQGVCVVIGDNFALGAGKQEKIGVTIYVR